MNQPPVTPLRPEVRTASAGTLAPLLVFLVGLGLTVAAAWWKQNDVHNDAEVQFQHKSQAVIEHISARLQRPIYGLHGARGLYSANQSIARAQFRAYVEARDMAREFPGVHGFGFIQRVQRPDLDAFIAAEQADGAPQFELRQLTDKSHDDFYIIKFIELVILNNIRIFVIVIFGMTTGRSSVKRIAFPSIII